MYPHKETNKSTHRLSELKENPKLSYGGVALAYCVAFHFGPSLFAKGTVYGYADYNLSSGIRFPTI